MTIKVRRLYGGHEGVIFLRMPKSLPGEGFRMFGQEARSKGQTGKIFVA